MSSRHVPGEMITDECALGHSGSQVLRTPLSHQIIKVISMSATEDRIRRCLEGSNMS